MFYFATYKVNGKEEARRFSVMEDYFVWLETWVTTQQMPDSLCVYRAECIFDGS